MNVRPVRVLTWNLQGSAGVDVAAVAQVVAAQQPDVVALQEVQRRQAGRLAAAMSMTSRRWAFKHWPVRHRAEGLALLSPHELAGAAPFTLRRAPFWDWRRRIGLEALVVRDDLAFSLVDVHLSPHDAVAARQREAAAVLARFDRVPPVICGDLNDLPGEVAYAAFVGAGWTDAWTATHTASGGSDGATNWTAGPRSGRVPTQRIDYVLAPPGAAVEGCHVAADPAAFDEFAQVSDHLPPHGCDQDGSLMSDTTTAVLAKVRKLLAKAEATDNEHEAAAFAGKAAALIAAHRIDVDRLSGGAPDELGVREVPVGRGAYVRARLALLQAVAGANDCEVVWRSSPDGAVAMLAGHTGDLAATTALFASLHVQAAAQLASVRRSTPAATQRWRRAFLFGYAARIGELLARSRREVEDAARAGGSLLPDVPARAARVRHYADTAFGRVVAARPPSPAAANGWTSGHRAATAADIGRARLAGRPALGPGGGS